MSFVAPPGDGSTSCDSPHFLLRMPRRPHILKKTTIGLHKHQGLQNTPVALWSGQYCLKKSTCTRNQTPSGMSAAKSQLSRRRGDLSSAKAPLKSADNQLLPTAPSWLDGMCRNVMVNGNQSKLLGSGAAAGLGMEENERENVPLISVKTDPRPADTVAAVASSRGSELTSVRKPEDSCSVIPSTKPWLFLLDKWEKRI